MRRKIRVVTRWLIKRRVKARARNGKGVRDTAIEWTREALRAPPAVNGPDGCSHTGLREGNRLAHPPGSSGSDPWSFRICFSHRTPSCVPRSRGLPEDDGNIYTRGPQTVFYRAPAGTFV